MAGGDLGMIGWSFEAEGGQEAIRMTRDLRGALWNLSATIDRDVVPASEKWAGAWTAAGLEGKMGDLEKKIEDLEEKMKDLVKQEKKGEDENKKTASSFDGIRKSVNSVGMALLELPIDAATKALRAMVNKAKGMFSELGDLNFDTSTQFEDEWVQARADMAKTMVGMSAEGKKALGPLFAYAKAKGETVQDLIKTLGEVRQASKDVTGSFGKDEIEQTKALDAIGKSFEMESADVIKGQSILQSRLKMTAKEALDLQGTVFALGKQYNMGKETIQGFTPALEKVVAAYDEAGMTLTADKARDATLSITQLALAYQKVGKSPKEAMGMATETFGKLLSEQKDVRNMMLGLGGDVSEIATKFGMAQGDVRPFFDLIQRGPAGAAQALLGMNQQLLKQKETLIATGQQGSSQYQAVNYQLTQFSQALNGLDPNMQDLINSNSKLYVDILSQAPGIMKGTGQAWIDSAKNANKSTVTFDEAWQRTVRSLDDARKLMGRGIAREAMGAISKAIRQTTKDMRDLGKGSGAISTVAKYFSAFSQVGLYAFIPALDKMGIVSKEKSVGIVHDLMMFKAPLEGLKKIGIDVFSSGGMIAGAIGFVGAISGAFGEGAQKWAKDLLGGLMDTAGVLWGWFKGQWPLIKSTFGEAIGTMWDGAKEWWPVLEGYLGETWQDLLDWTAGIDWTQVWTYLGQGIVFISEKIYQGINFMLEKTWELIDTILSGWRPEIRTKGGEAGQGFILGFVDAVQESSWGKKLTEAIAQQLELAVAMFMDYGKKMAAILGAVFSKESLADIMNPVATLTGSVWTRLSARIAQNVGDLAKEKTEVAKVQERIDARREMQKAQDLEKARLAGLVWQGQQGDKQIAEAGKKEYARQKNAEVKKVAKAVRPPSAVAQVGPSPLEQAMTEQTTASRANSIRLGEVAQNLKALNDTLLAQKGGGGGGGKGGGGGGGSAPAKSKKLDDKLAGG